MPIFDHAHPITKLKYLLAFLDNALGCKKIIQYIHPFIQKLESHADFFYHNDPKIIEVILNFPYLASVCKKSTQFIHSFIHSSCDQGGHTHFWPHLHLKRQGKEEVSIQQSKKSNADIAWWRSSKQKRD